MSSAVGGKKADKGNEEPEKASKKWLAHPLDLIARGQLAFLTRVLVKPVSELARRMVFVSIADPTGKRTSTRYNYKHKMFNTTCFSMRRKLSWSLWLVYVAFLQVR